MDMDCMKSVVCQCTTKKRTYATEVKSIADVSIAYVDQGSIKEIFISAKVDICMHCGCMEYASMMSIERNRIFVILGGYIPITCIVFVDLSCTGKRATSAIMARYTVIISMVFVDHIYTQEKVISVIKEKLMPITFMVFADHIYTQEKAISASVVILIQDIYILLVGTRSTIPELTFVPRVVSILEIFTVFVAAMFIKDMVMFAKEVNCIPLRFTVKNSFDILIQVEVVKYQIKMVEVKSI